MDVHLSQAGKYVISSDSKGQGQHNVGYKRVGNHVFDLSDLAQNHQERHDDQLELIPVPGRRRWIIEWKELE